MKTPMSLLLRHCRVLNPLNGDITPADIEIRSGVISRVVPFGHGVGAEVVDCGGKYASYGFADAHFHLESTLLSPAHLAEVLLRKGTTSLYVNPHEVANVGGLNAVRQLMESAKRLPIRLYLIVPCKVPTAPILERSGAAFNIQALRKMLEWPQTVGIGEMDAYKLMHPTEPYTSFIKMAQAKGLRVCGSVQGLSPKQLEACIAAGITDDHESISGAEALEKLRGGLYIHVREGSSERNLESILQEMLKHPESLPKLCFCSDDKTCDDLISEGHIDCCIRKAIALGYPPAQAYRMGAYNIASYYDQAGVHGLIAPGRKADIVLLDDLERVSVTDVFFNGIHVIRNHMPLQDGNRVPEPICGLYTVKWKQPLREADLQITAPSGTLRAAARVIRLLPGQIVNRLVSCELPVQGRVVCADPAQDIQYYALAERYRGESLVVNAFVQGFGLKRGAIATSVSHDHHHLVSIGANQADMALALNLIAGWGGGMVVVRDGKLLASLKLPLWGLMSQLPSEQVSVACRTLCMAASVLGWSAEGNPFTALSLLSIPVIPEAGMTDQGLVDVCAQKVVPVLL